MEPNISDSEDRNSRAMVRFASATSAMMNGDWEQARQICSEELATPGLDADYEALGRKAHCEALTQTGLRQADDSRKKQQIELAVDEGRRACLLFDRPSFDDHGRSEAHQLLGTALVLLGLEHAAGSPQRTQLTDEGISHLENSLKFDPLNHKATEQLERARKVQADNRAKAKSGACFVITAVYGNPFAPEVVLMSSFRDSVLRRNRVGRLFVRSYCAVGPLFAEIVADHPRLRVLARSLIVEPSVKCVRRFWPQCGNQPKAN